MSTLVNQPVDDHDIAVNTGQNSSPSVGNSMTQITSGPAALAQLLIYEIMTLYGEIVQLQSEQKKTEIEAQEKTAVGQADATAAAGKAYGNALIWAGAITLGAGVLSLATTVGMEAVNTRGLKAEEKEVNEQLKPMNNVEKFLSTEPANGSGGRDLNGNNARDPAVETRMGELERGEYKNAKDDRGETEQAIKRLKAGGRDGNFDYNKWKDEFRQKLDRMNRSQTGFIQRRNTAQMQAQQYGQFANSLGQFGSQVKQGQGTAEQAKYNAAATLQGTASQMAGSVAGDAGQAMAKAYDAQNQEVQVLERIHQTNSVNG